MVKHLLRTTCYVGQYFSVFGKNQCYYLFKQNILHARAQLIRRLDMVAFVLFVPEVAVIVINFSRRTAT